ncbi:50S ribosomal protein L6 [Candidatus Micrarchaeota archaeon]|nr:50S ribosomal protein L6 [Candidatus Micrarchaeota archaeon]
MDIPNSITLKIQGNKMLVSGPKGTLEKHFDSKKLEVVVEGSKVEVKPKQKLTRKMNAMASTIRAHLKNMFKGVTEGYEKKLSLVYAHFPITIEIKGKDVSIKNFFGEKTPRKTKIVGDTKVEVKGQDIVVTGSNKEEVAQSASNLVRVTKVNNRDARVFQDGIYYTK